MNVHTTVLMSASEEFAGAHTETVRGERVGETSVRTSSEVPAICRATFVRACFVVLVAACSFFSTNHVQAQIQVVPNPGAQAMGNALMQPGGDLTLLSTTLNARGSQVGTYSLGPLRNNYGISRPGIVLSTGLATMCQTGPNTRPSPAGVGIGGWEDYASSAQVVLLNAINTGLTGSDYVNCAELSITFFSPEATQIVFECTFGTEEYARYVGTGYIDPFGIFLNGSTPSHNIAIVDGQPINVNHRGMTSVTETELNGVIVHNRSASFSVVGNAVSGINTLTFIIADRSDPLHDSAVYISGLRVRCPPATITQQPASISICPPETATFSVSATGAGLRYRWFWIPEGQTTPRPFLSHQGSNTPTLSFTTLSEHCGARVFCEVTGPCDIIVRTQEATISCCPCAPPPSTMSLWLPFDDISPSGITRNLIGGHNGVLMPAGSPPWLWQGVFVRNSLFFDGYEDYVMVRNHSLVDITVGDLTIDAWIFTKVIEPGVSVIVDKRSEGGSSSTVFGYHMFTVSDGTSLRLGFQLADGGFTNWVSSQELPSTGGWTHVAVTIDRDDPNGGRFYINGAPAGAFNPTARQGSLSNLSPFTVGARSTSPSGFFFGGIDEVEVFRRALAPSEIAAIYNAKAVGKCKLFVQAYPPTIFCANSPSTTIGAHVFNFTPAPVQLFPSFWPMPCTDFAPSNLPVGLGPVTLSSGSRTWVETNAVMPPGMMLGDRACYSAVMLVVPTTFPDLLFISDEGQIVYRPDIRCSDGVATLVQQLPLGAVGNVSLAFENAGIGSGQFAWRVDALGPDGQPTRTLSIEGDQPGNALFGDAFVPVGASFELNLSVSFHEVDVFGMTTLLLSTDTDGDGVYEPAVSASLLCVVPGPCPGDTNGDGVVNFADLNAVLSNFGLMGAGIVGDLNNDGVVNFADLNLVLTVFGTPCE